MCKNFLLRIPGRKMDRKIRLVPLCWYIRTVYDLYRCRGLMLLYIKSFSVCRTCLSTVVRSPCSFAGSIVYKGLDKQGYILYYDPFELLISMSCILCLLKYFLYLQKWICSLFKWRIVLHRFFCVLNGRYKQNNTVSLSNTILCRKGKGVWNLTEYWCVLWYWESWHPYG